MTVFDWQVYRHNLDVLLYTNLKHFFFISIVSVLIRWDDWDAIWPVSLSIVLVLGLLN